jgi:hypothetical protein
MFENAHLTVEADILIFDPYKVTATGGTGAGCYSKQCDERRPQGKTSRKGLFGPGSLMVSSRNLARNGDTDLEMTDFTGLSRSR